MITKPIVILGAPRSGTSILYRCLSIHPDLWHLPAESHSILEGPFHPVRNGYESNRVTRDGLDERVTEQVRTAFYRRVINLNRVLADPTSLLAAKTVSGRIAAKIGTTILGMASWLTKPENIRIVEKTPKNTLRVPLLDRIFPDALYVITMRRADLNIDSLISGWSAYDEIGPVRRKRYATYPIAEELDLKDYDGKWWNYVLVPGWRNFKGKTVSEVAAWQYYQCNRYLFEDLSTINPRRKLYTTYEELTAEPREVVNRILSWAGLSFAEVVGHFADEQVRPGRRTLNHPIEVRAALKEMPYIVPLQAGGGYD